MIDLHVHTTMSDGTLSPEAVVLRAAALGLMAIAVTDHDTLAGVEPAQDAGSRAGVQVVAGVEISAQWDSGILHVLGYFVDTHDAGLLESLERLRNWRQERIPRVIEKLNRCNVLVSQEDVEREASGGVPGRPHVANVLVRKGYVGTAQEAFDRYLRRGAPAYHKKTKMSVDESIHIISAAGGVPVLAHPYSLGENDPGTLEETVADLAGKGLKGIEVYYPVHTSAQTSVFASIARKLNLAITGGTDFHGTNKPDVELGVVPFGGPLPYSLLENLRAKI